MKSEINIAANRLQITRIFNAPPLQVFTWWSQPEKLAQWSGCKEATSCKVEMDFRKGGKFTQTMQITGCGEFSLKGVYDEILPPERIVYHADLGYAKTKITLEFKEHGDQTKVILTQEGFPSEDLCKTVVQGTQESFEKLDSLLVRPQTEIGTPVGAEGAR